MILPPSTADPAKAMLRKNYWNCYLPLFALIYISLSLTIFPSLQSENSPEDIAVVLQYLAGILVLQITVLALCWRFISLKASIRVAAVLTTINALALSLSFSETFLVLRSFEQIVIVEIVAVAALLLYWASFKRPVFGLTFLVLYAVAILGQTVFSLPAGGHGSSGKSSVLDIPQGMKNISFHYFPNLYIVSFDAMIPDALAGKFFGERFSKLEYSDYLRSSGAMIFKNVFADRVPTKQSINSLLNLSINPYTDGKNQYAYFSGKSDSILYRIFRENGYRVSSGFSQGSYFGAKGSYVDEYLSSERFPFCKFRLDWYYLEFFGFCHALDAFKERSRVSRTDWVVRVLASIAEKAANKRGRWLSYYYIYDPVGHTPRNFAISNENAILAYKDYFWNQAAKVTPILKELLATVRSKDPDGIILIFGDHGTWLSRDLELDSGEEFWVQDRHGVFAAVVGNPKCRQGAEFVSNHGFTTPSLIMSRLLSCLSGSKLSADTIPGPKWDHEFGRFLYE